jgi:hypothetical protein
MRKLFFIILLISFSCIKPMEKYLYAFYENDIDSTVIKISFLKNYFSFLKKEIPEEINQYNLILLAKAFDLNPHELAKELKDIIPQANTFIEKKKTKYHFLIKIQ